MRRPSWSSFWTVLAAIAGVVGAAAAVYPLFQPDQQAARLAFPHYLDSPPYHVWVVTLSDPVVLTGGWYIKRGPWWHAQTLRDGAAVGTVESTSLASRPLKDVRVAMNERKLVFIDERPVEEWSSGALAPCNAGELEMGVEYTWRGGSSWARTTLPLCVTKRR
jgi:hypothetical protein